MGAHKGRKTKQPTALAVITPSPPSLVDKLKDVGWIFLTDKVANALQMPMDYLLNFTNELGEFCLRSNGEYLCAPDFFRKVTPKFAAAPQDDYMILKAKLEDLEARDSVIRQYENLVHKLANKKFSYYMSNFPDNTYPQHTTPDFEQMARLGLLHAIIHYDWSASFMTFAYICVEHNIHRMTRTLREGKDILAHADSLDEAIPLDGDSDLFPIDTIPAKEDTDMDVYQSQILDLFQSEMDRMGFTGMERQVLIRRVLYDDSLDEIGVGYNLTRERIRQIQNKLTKRLRLYSPALRAAFEKHSSEL